MDTAPQTLVAEPTSEADPGACRTDRGDQKSGPGVIAAFEYAYYITRSGAAVRALTTPPTPHCRRQRKSKPESTQSQQEQPTAYGSPQSRPMSTPSHLQRCAPGAEPAQFPQTITTKNIDGRWFVDVIS